LHPGTRIVLYVLAALVIPGLSFFMVLSLGLVAQLIALGRGRSAWALVRRARWLFLILILGYGYAVPGEAIFGSVSLFEGSTWLPTHEGLKHGLVQALSLMVMLLWLDVLVLSMPMTETVGGLLALLMPLHRLGLPAERFALRLALTLDVMDAHQGRHQKVSSIGHRDRLARILALEGVDDVPDKIQVVTRKIPPRDWGAVAVAVALGLGAALA